MDNRTMDDLLPGLLDTQELKTVGPRIARANPWMGLLGEVIAPPSLNIGADLDREAAYAAQDRMNQNSLEIDSGDYKTRITEDDESFMVYAPHLEEEERMTDIAQKVMIQGSPKIRAVWSGDAWLAIEGSHRLKSAKNLGVKPIIEELELDDVVQHDLQDLENPTDVSSIVEYLHGGQNPVGYNFTEAEGILSP